jgi:hypothetical protein
MLVALGAERLLPACKQGKERGMAPRNACGDLRHG